VQTADDCFLQLATKIANQGKISKNEYAARASFLTSLSLFQETKYTTQFHSLDTMCNAAHLAEYTFQTLSSLQRDKTCTTCNYVNNRKFTAVSINVNIILHEGWQYIQESINDMRSTKQMCPKCDSPYKINEEYHIISYNLI